MKIIIGIILPDDWVLAIGEKGYPCEETKLKMHSDIFDYAIESRMLNVTGCEGAKKMGNVFSSGNIYKGR